jgi:hypothetical protein
LRMTLDLDWKIGGAIKWLETLEKRIDQLEGVVERTPRENYWGDLKLQLPVKAKQRLL